MYVLIFYGPSGVRYVCTHFLRAIWCSQLTPEQIIDFIHHSLTQYHSVVFGYTAIVNAIALAIDICTTKDIMDKGSLYRRRRNPDRGDCARQRRRRGGDRTTPWACRSVDHHVPQWHKLISFSITLKRICTGLITFFTFPFYFNTFLYVDLSFSQGSIFSKCM